MSFVLHRIRKALAEPPEEPMTHAVLVAVNAHWKSLFDKEINLSDELAASVKEMNRHAQVSLDAEEKRVTCQLALWEAKRAAFQIEATLGGAPGTPGPLQSSDWGTNWILFEWTAPENGGLPWGYRVERSADNRDFYTAEMCVDTEVTLIRQPQGQKFYYRVVAFNGWGDGAPSPVFGIKFDTELVDLHKPKKSPKKDDG
jgi:hypothetical protein